MRSSDLCHATLESDALGAGLLETRRQDDDGCNPGHSAGLHRLGHGRSRHGDDSQVGNRRE